MAADAGADRLRNVAVVGAMAHGKSTLVRVVVPDSPPNALLSQSDVDDDTDQDDVKAAIPIFGQTGGPQEDLRGMTLRSSLACTEVFHDDPSPLVSATARSNPPLATFIDTPGHVDFALAEVSTALRLVDGAIVVVDCVEGATAFTLDHAVRAALAKRVRPVLFLNKLDLRLSVEQEADASSIYGQLQRTVALVNDVLATYDDADVARRLRPERGEVVFGSGIGEWGFSIPQFARLYAAKFGVNEQNMANRLWGEHYYCMETKRWVTGKANRERKHAFVQFCIEPLQQMYRAAHAQDFDTLDKMLPKFQVAPLSASDRGLPRKQLIKRVLSQCLPLRNAVLEMTVEHLPSPRTAQKYRAAAVYSGDTTDLDKAFVGIQRCDSDGPMVIYVGKMMSVATERSSRLFALGRVFSGCARPRTASRILANSRGVADGGGFDGKPLGRCLAVRGRYMVPVESAPAGSLVVLEGMHPYLLNSGTILDAAELTASPIFARKAGAAEAATVRVLVEPKRAVDLPRLVAGLKYLAQIDDQLECAVEATGVHTVAAVGALQLQVALDLLQRDLLSGAPLSISDPFVALREGLHHPTSTYQSKASTPNTANILSCCMRQLPEPLCTAVERGPAGSHADPQSRAALLRQDFEWSVEDTEHGLWSFGPSHEGPNMLIRGHRLGEVEHGTLAEQCIAGFQWATHEGPLCGEALRGVRVDVDEVELHDSTSLWHGFDRAIHKAMCCTLQIDGVAALFEPMYAVELSFPRASMSAIFSLIGKRRGHLITDDPGMDGTTCTARATLPVRESTTFIEALRRATAGMGFAQMVHDGWQRVPSYPVARWGPPHNPSPVTEAEILVAEYRSMKGMKPFRKTPGVQYQYVSPGNVVLRM